MYVLHEITNIEKKLYRTAGFVCEVLIVANYVRCYRLANFNCTVTFNSALFLMCYSSVPCDLYLI